MRCECLKCGLIWNSTVDRPRVCPSCKSYKWQEPRKRKKPAEALPEGESVVSLTRDAQLADNERRSKERKEREEAEGYVVDPALQEQLDKEAEQNEDI